MGRHGCCKLVGMETGQRGVQDTQEVASGLREIAGLLRFGKEPKFKILAYERAAQVVDTLGDELATVVEQDRLRSLKGIGPQLAERIRELWNTGASPYLERLRQQSPPGAADLVRVPGLSPRRIRLLHESLGVQTVEQLREACASQRVRRVPGFGEKTEQRLLAACERWLAHGASRGSKPALYAHALTLAESLERALVGSAERVAIAGDLRRGQETVTELELVVQGEAVRAWQCLDRRREVLRSEPARSLAHLADGLKLRLHVTEAADWGRALLEATGSPAHLAALRERAARLGVDPSARFETEDALYAALGLPLIPPELRNDSEVLEQAEREGFAGLVELGDVKGLVHCHTSYSDGKQSVLEMASAAHAAGMAYITITDHSPSAFYAKGVPLDRLERQWEEIAAASERVPIRILRGVESDILRDGLLDYPDHVIERLDVVIASVHARYRMTPPEMTARLVRAMSLPVFKIWGHGLGRILNHRPPIECDVPAVLDALAASRGAVELNADPWRLDLPPSWIPEARRRGLPFVISVDAHSTRGFEVLRYGVTMARRGGLTAREVLNTLGPAEFSARVKPIATG